MPHDGGEVEPHVLPRDQSVAELDHVQQAVAEGTVLAFEAERAADGAAVPHDLVDEEVRSVQPDLGVDAFAGDVGEQVLVERAGLGAPVVHAIGHADDVLHDVFGQGRQHAVDVVVGFEAVMLVEHPVHLRWSELHRVSFCPCSDHWTVVP